MCVTLFNKHYVFWKFTNNDLNFSYECSVVFLLLGSLFFSPFISLSVRYHTLYGHQVFMYLSTSSSDL